MDFQTFVNLCAAFLILAIPVYSIFSYSTVSQNRNLRFGIIWFLKLLVYFVYLGIICTYLFHEGGHVLILVLANIPFQAHLNFTSLPYISPLKPLPFSVNIIFHLAGIIFELFFGYLFLFTDNKYSLKFRNNFIKKDFFTIFLFMLFVLLGGYRDIMGVFLLIAV